LGAARPPADRGRDDAARGAAAPRKRARHPLPRGGGRRSRRGRAARRARPWLDLHLRRHARRVPPPRDPRRLAALPDGARAAGDRPPRRHRPPRRAEARRVPGAIVALAVLAVALAAALAWRLRPPRALRPPHGGRRILLPFAGCLDPTVLDAAIRIAHAE